MLSSKLLAIAAVGLGLLAGCAGARGAGVAELPPGTTAIRVTNHVAGPGTLERLTVTVDGQMLALGAVPPEGGDPATVAKLRLAPGPHLIAVRARAAHTPGAAVLVVGTQQPFHVGRSPAAITIEVRSFPPAAGGGPTPISVGLTMVGGSMAPEFGQALADDKDERCGALLPIPRAICRAAFDLDQATRNNDIVGAFCVRDKLAEMRRIALVGEDGKGDSVAMAEASVQALSKQVELCSGSYAAPAREGLTVVPPAAR